MMRGHQNSQANATDTGQVGWLFISVVLFALLLLPGTSQAKLLTFTGEEETIIAAPYTDFLEDSTGQLTLQQVSSAEYASRFTANTAPTLDFGYTQSTWWLRLEVQTRTGQLPYLWVNSPLLMEVELFAPALANQQTAHTPAIERLANQRTPVWQLALPPGETVTLYIRVANPRTLLCLPIQLMTSKALLEQNQTLYSFFMFIYAGMAVLALYNLLLFINLRERGYLSLVFFIIAAFFVSNRHGNLFPSLAFINDSSSAFYLAPYLCGAAAGFYFWRGINQNANRFLEQLLKWLQWIALGMLPLIGFLPPSLQPLYLFFAALTPLLILVITHVSLQGHRQTVSTYWAALVLLVSVWFDAFSHSGWFNEYSKLSPFPTHIGILTALLLLSINQADRSRILREQAERAQAANQAKDAFLTTMSHELRTPMHTVMGIGELLKQTALTPTQQNYLSKQALASQHMLDLVDNILDLARITHSAPEIRQEPFCLALLLEELNQLFATAAAQKGLELHIAPVPAYAQGLVGDKELLKRLLVNLVGNAIKYTDQGLVMLRLKAPPPAPGGSAMILIRFEIIDTGIGISTEQQQYLFKPFYQADPSHARRHGGSGLGLAISHALVKHMGGTLQLESTLGKGSRFFFTLPFPTQNLTGNKAT